MVGHDANSTSRAAEDSRHDSNSSKQAACLECRRSKTKCNRSANADACKKCASAGIDCIVPEYHVGRYKGVKNKRSGLDKAIHQVEEAVKRARKSDGQLPNQHAQALKKLLEDSKAADEHSANQHQKNLSVADGYENSAASGTPVLHSEGVNVLRSPSPHNNCDNHPNTDDVTVNNANNPLQLLAIASAIPDQSSTDSPVANNKVTPDNRSAVEDDETYNFFSPITSKLDVGPDLDPIDLGLVTGEEAKVLFE